MLLLALSDLMRMAHTMAGGVWIGGSVVYLLVIIPALRLGKAAPEVGAHIAAQFRRLVNISIVTLLLSGVYLTFDRLTTTTVGAAYVVTLAVKIALALLMFGLALFQAQEARRPARLRGRLWRLTPRLILALGLVVFLLGAVLSGLFDVALGVAR
jgi:putative copper export protein